jgi:hypothetical protein
MKAAGLIQLHSGDAISGIVSRRLPWFRFLKVEMPELLDAKTGATTPADGVVWVPKSNVMFFQQLIRVVEQRQLSHSKTTLPGPLTNESPSHPTTPVDAQKARR